MTPGEVLGALGEPGAAAGGESVSTGSLSLDRAIGGWPLGRISVIYGPPFTAKSTLALCGAREMQNLGLTAVSCRREMAGYVDLDGDFDPLYAARIGVDLTRVWLFGAMPPPSCPAPYVIVNSVKSDDEAEDIRRFAAASPGVTILAVSQTARYTPGYLCEAPVRVLVTEHLDTMHVTVTRDSRRSARGEAWFRCCPDGIDQADEIFQMAVADGLITRHGSWYMMGDRILGQGEAVAQRAVSASPETTRCLRQQLGV